MIPQKISEIHKNIPPHVTLVCVSKFQPAKSIQEAYNAGERVFGESRVQELNEKYQQLPKDIQWHFIGHLQTNKIKYIIPFVSLIHGVDSYKLLVEINKAAQKINRVVNCLLQVHIAQEDTKFGFSEAELLELLATDEWKKLTNIQICGLMGMATFTNNQTQVNQEFESLKKVFDTLKTNFFTTQQSFKEISMGMSDDYKLAITNGSTMVRIGSSIFGHRK